MLWSDATNVTLGARTLGGVRSVVLKERASETIVEHESVGRAPTFVDVVGVRAEFVIEREVLDAAGAQVRVGDRGTLRFEARRESGGRGAVVAAEVVVTGVAYRVDGAAFVETVTAMAYGATAMSAILSVTREGAAL